MGRSSVVNHSQSPSKERPLSASRKSRDPVEDALDIRRRQREAQQRALELRRDKEMQECSFSPTISHVSREMAEANPYRRAAPLHERSLGRTTHLWAEDTSASSKVQMNEVSRVIAAALPGRDLPIGERAFKEKQAFEERMKKEAEEKQRREIEEVTHAPQIDRNSAKLVQKRQGAKDAMGRLADEYVRKQEEARGRAKREAEEKLSQELAKPTYVNKQSERLLQRAADSGREIKGIDAGCKTPRTLSSAGSSQCQRFDNEISNTGLTPRQIRANPSKSPTTTPFKSPTLTPRTARSSILHMKPAREHPSNVLATTSKSPRSPRSPRKSPRSPRKSPRVAHHGSPNSPTSRLASGGISRLGVTQKENAGVIHDDKICSANPKSIGDGASEIKWLARMGRTVSVPNGSHADDPVRANRTDPSFNSFSEMDKMRLEFQKFIKVKEEETKMLLEQIRAQKVEGPNAELREENESLRDELEAQIERVSDLEMMVEQQKSIIEEGEAVKIEREQLRKSNEKLRLDLEAITEKGQAVVELNAKLMAQVKALKKAKVSGKTKQSIELDSPRDYTDNEDKSIAENSETKKVSSKKKTEKKFAEFLDESSGDER